MQSGGKVGNNKLPAQGLLQGFSDEVSRTTSIVPMLTAFPLLALMTLL